MLYALVIGFAMCALADRCIRQYRVDIAKLTLQGELYDMGGDIDREYSAGRIRPNEMDLYDDLDELLTSTDELVPVVEPLDALVMLSIVRNDKTFEQGPKVDLIAGIAHSRNPVLKATLDRYFVSLRRYAWQRHPASIWLVAHLLGLSKNTERLKTQILEFAGTDHGALNRTLRFV